MASNKDEKKVASLLALKKILDTKSPEKAREAINRLGGDSSTYDALEAIEVANQLISSTLDKN